MLRETVQKIFISESLTQRNKKLFNQCVKAKKEKKFKFPWTSSGKILLRKDSSHPAIQIKNANDHYKHIYNLKDPGRVLTGSFEASFDQDFDYTTLNIDNNRGRGRGRSQASAGSRS